MQQLFITKCVKWYYEGETVTLNERGVRRAKVKPP